MNQSKWKQPIVVYLGIVLGTCFGFGMIELITNTGRFYQFLGIAFTFIPVIAAMLTRRITQEKSRYHLSLKVWKDPKAWSFSAFVPTLLIVPGAVLYFLVFRDQYSGVFEYGKRIGTDAAISMEHPILVAFACVIIGALMIPVQLLELGEEIGWRGYLLSFQVEKYGERKAVIINGIEWGVSHLSLIYFGFNYSLENFGAPWTNMLLMVVVCVVLGIIFSYITIQTQNCMYAAIMHGAVNTVGELPVYLTYDMKSGLLGPNPTGLITISFMMLFAVILFFAKLKKD